MDRNAPISDVEILSPLQLHIWFAFQYIFEICLDTLAWISFGKFVNNFPNPIGCQCFDFVHPKLLTRILCVQNHDLCVQRHKVTLGTSLIKHIFTLVTLYMCFYFCWNCIDSSVWRQRGNEAVEVSFECRTARMSALFHIFTCAFCVISFILPMLQHCPQMFCLMSLICTFYSL